MTTDDLDLLLRLGMVETTGQPGEYKLTRAGRIMAGEPASKPGVRDTQQWIEGAQRQAETKQSNQPTLRRVK